MAPEKLDLPDADSLKPLVQRLLTRIDELLAQIKAQNARVAELEAKLGQPPKTPDNSSLPPSRAQKANAEPLATKPPRKGRPGVTTRARREAVRSMSHTRVHILRHGTDIDNAMVALSTYVGHAKVSDTYWYLTAAPDLMSAAGRRFEQLVEVGDA
jgi:hypothetical protein